MSKLNNIDLHSEEVREIMGQIPGWIVRWGLSVVFGVFVVIVIGSYFLKYPETITAPVVITTINPPVELICKVSGKIQKLTVADEQQVNAGALIAVIENTGNFDDYLLLKAEMERIGQPGDWREIVMAGDNTMMLSLGDMQSSYEQFRKNWNSFRNYLLMRYINQKIELLRNQIVKENEYLQVLRQQQSIQETDFQLSKKRVNKDSAVYITGGLSEKEFENEKQQLLQKESALKGFEASRKSAESSIISLKQNILELQLQEEKEISQYILSLDESRQNLETIIRKWEEQYLVTSPINGKINLSKFWSENQAVNAGDRLATVIPEEETKVVGRTMLPRAGFGKVEKGQKVQIKLNGFPYMEYGMLTGYIRSISEIPENEGYLAEIELPWGMLSNYSQKLRFIHEMDGTAVIITDEKRMISRFINPIKSMIHK